MNWCFYTRKSNLRSFHSQMETNNINTFLQLHKTQVKVIIYEMMMWLKHLLAVGKKGMLILNRKWLESEMSLQAVIALTLHIRQRAFNHLAHFDLVKCRYGTALRSRLVITFSQSRPLNQHLPWMTASHWNVSLFFRHCLAEQSSFSSWQASPSG